MKCTVLSLIGFLLCVLPSACFSDRDQPAPAKESKPVKTEAATPTLGDQRVAVQQSGTISGRVLFKGKHVPAILAIGKDKEICGNSIKDPRLLVAARGEIKNAVVRITEIAAGKAAAAGEALLDQRKCEFVPHVLAIAAGTAVNITNSDGILHNIHTLSKDNPAFNRAQPKYLTEITQTFSRIIA